MWAIVAVAIVFLILVFSEYLSRYKGVHSELTRKFVHVFVGTFVAFWPFFLSWRQIQFLSLSFLVVVSLSVKFDVFRSIHAVKRNANGKILFALAIGLLAFITTSPWIFAASMLHLSIADGLAAIVGLAWGDSSRYKVLHHTKTLTGSLAFFFASLVIMIGYAAFSGDSYSATTIIWLPVMATIAENLAVQGTDNLVLPLLVALVLSSSL